LKINDKRTNNETENEKRNTLNNRTKKTKKRRTTKTTNNQPTGKDPIVGFDLTILGVVVFDNVVKDQPQYSNGFVSVLLTLNSRVPF